MLNSIKFDVFYKSNKVVKMLDQASDKIGFLLVVLWLVDVIGLKTPMKQTLSSQVYLCTDEITSLV